MDHYYAIQRPLPHDFSYLCRVARCFSKHEKSCLRTVLETFFDIINQEVTHGRIDREIIKYQQTVDAARNAAAMRWQSERICPPEARSQIEPEVNLKPKIKDNNKGKASVAFAPPVWVPEEAWNGYKAMRKKLRKPMTERAEKMLVNDLEKLKDAGEDITACLEQSELRCWLGVFAVKPAGGNGSSSPQPDPLCAKCGGSTNIGFIYTSDGRVCSRCRAQL